MTRDVLERLHTNRLTRELLQREGRPVPAGLDLAIEHDEALLSNGPRRQTVDPARNLRKVASGRARAFAEGAKIAAAGALFGFFTFLALSVVFS